MDRLGFLAAVRVAATRENEALSTGGSGLRSRMRDAEIGAPPEVADLGVPAPLDAGIHHSTAVLAIEVVGQCVRHGRPIAGGKLRQEAVMYLAGRVFRPWCRPA